MGSLQGRSGLFQSVLLNAPAQGNAPTLSFTVPAGTYFEGQVSYLGRSPGINAVPVMTIDSGGNTYAVISHQSNPAASQDLGACVPITLPAGTYTSAWFTPPAASGTNKVSISGICKYL